MLYLFDLYVYIGKNSEGSGNRGAAVVPVFGRLRQEDYFQFVSNLGYIITIS